MALGRPIQLTGNVASKVIRVLATANQTVFTVNGGYRINQLGVFKNGDRLSNNSGFTALDGVTVTLASPASLNDEILFEVQDDFRVADAIVSVASSQTIHGNLAVNGAIYGITEIENLTITNNLTTGNINSSGVVTATSFVGSGASLTGIDATALKDSGGNIKVQANSSGAVVTGVVTATSFVGDVTGNVTGNITGNITGVDATFSGNVSVGGTITYEDVTNVDSIGVITARSGIVATGVVTATSFSGSGANLTNLNIPVGFTELDAMLFS